MKSDCSNRIQRCRYSQMLRRKTYNSSHSVTRSVSSGKRVYVANYESKTLKSHLDFILIYYILSTGKRTALEELNTGIVAWVHEFDQIFETFCVSEPRCVERGHAEGQPIQVYLPGNHSIVCMLQWWRRICVRQRGVHSAAFLTQVSKAPSSESLEQGRASDSNQVGETTKRCSSDWWWALWVFSPYMPMWCGCVSEPRYAERGDAESQPVQVCLSGNYSIVCMLPWWWTTCVRWHDCKSF